MALLLVVSAAVACATEADRKNFNLPAGVAGETLKQFALQAGREIVFSPEAIGAVPTKAVKGELPPREALDLMLADTGLVVSQDAKTGAIAVRKRLAGPNGDRARTSGPLPVETLDPSAPKKPVPMKTKSSLSLLFGWLAFAVAPAHAADAVATGSDSRATGVIAGRVFNPVSGSYLNNTRIIVEGTNLSTFTNESGEYRLANVPAGEARVTASFTGLLSKTAVVSVGAGQITQRNFDLVPPGHGVSKEEVIVMSAFTIAEQQMNAQMIALNEQRRAPNIRNVVSADEFGDTGEGNVGEFLKYVPGINIEYSSVLAQGISIRGLPSSGTLVTLDGGQIASATIGSGDGRAVNLDALRLNNMSRIEVTKVPTPDLPANAQGGSVNIISKSGFERKTPLFSYRAYANMNVMSLRDSGPFDPRPVLGDGKLSRRPVQPAFDFSYIKPVNDNFALTFSAGFSERYLHLPSAFTEWDLVQNVLLDSRPSPLQALQQVGSGSLGADWRIGKNSVLSASGMFASTSWHGIEPELNIGYGAGATGDGLFVQGATPGVGTGTLAPLDADTRKKTVQGSLRYQYKGELFRLDAAVHHGQNRSTYPDVDRGVFNTASLTATQLVIRGEGIDRSEHKGMPTKISAVTRAGVPFNLLDTGEYSIASVTSNQRIFTDAQSSAKVKVARDFDFSVPVTIQTGAAVDRQTRDLWRNFRQWTFRPGASTTDRQAKNYNLVDKDYSAVSPNYFPETQRIQWVTAAKLYDLYLQHPEYFVPNDLNNYNNSANFGKRFQETVSAAFIRGDVRLFQNRLWAVGGVRFENTRDVGEGPLTDSTAIYARDANGNLMRDSAGRLVLLTTDAVAQAKLRVKSRGAHSDTSYHGYYPSLNLNFNVTENVVLRAAYARTITRPNIASIIPGTTLPDPSTAVRTITVVNTGLRPWSSDGYDLSLESYQIKGGTGSVGVFQKDIQGFFGGTTTRATPELLARYGLDDEFANYDITAQTNLKDPVRIRGVEFSFRQSVGVWVPLLKDFGLSGAATFLDIQGPAEANFATFSPKTINGSITYSRSRFSIRFNAIYIGLKKGSGLTGVSASIPPGTYRWFPARAVYTANFSYRVYKQVSIYGTVSSLSGNDVLTERYAPGTPAYARPYRFQGNGSDFTLGVKGEF